jgi:pyruvate/2-oxoglutarate/acetoin dehydrogenase E1 component
MNEPISYKQALTAAMDALALDKRVVFLGYGLRSGRAAGTLANVPEAQIIETPVAESLMAGLAIGLSLRGQIPVVFYERFDFVLYALDQIVNHLDKMAWMSAGQFRPAVLFRVVAGGKHKPLYTGPTHTQDFTSALWRLVNFPVMPIVNASQVETCWSIAHTYAAPPKGESGSSCMLVEYKDKYA